MTNRAGSDRPNERTRKGCRLSITIFAIVCLLIIPDSSIGKTFFGGTRSDSSDREEISRQRRTGESQSQADEDQIRRKSRKSKQSMDSGKSDESLKRKEAVGQKDTSKIRERKLVEKGTRDSSAAKAPPRRTGSILEPISELGRSSRQRALNDPRGLVKLHGNELEKALKKGDVKAQKDAHTSLGQTFFFTGQYKKATEHHSKAVELARRSGIPKERGRSLHHLAAAWLALANYRTAARYGRESLQAFEQAGDTEGVATAYNDLGKMEKDRGRFQKAVQNYQKALDANKEKNQLRFITLTNLAGLYLAWGEYKKAVDHYKEALESVDATKSASSEGDTLINIAKAYSEWGLHDEALDNASQGLKSLSKSGARTESARKVIGDLYMDTGQMDQAEPYVKASGYESALGRLYLLKRQYNDARTQYERLKGASERDGNLEDSFTALTGLGKVAESLKDHRGAEEYYSKAVNVTEQIRSTLMLAERRNFFAASINGFPRSEPAKGLVRVTLKQNKPEQSLYASELVRARAFADNLTERTDGRNFSVPSDVLEKEEGLTNRLATLMEGRDLIPKSADKERFDEISSEIQSLDTDRNSFLQMLWTRYPAYASAKYPRPTSLHESAISPEEYIIVFDLLGEGLGVKLLKGKAILDAYFVELNLKELEEDVYRFRKSFEQVKLAQFDVKLAEALYAKLLARTFRQIPDGTPASIVPDGFLALLPFEALVAQGEANWQNGPWGPFPQGIKYAADIHPLSYYQSVSAMTLVRTLTKTRRADGNRLLVMADPVFAITDARVQQEAPDMRVAANMNDRKYRLMAAVEEEIGGSLNLSRLPGTGELAQGLKKLYGMNADLYLGLQSSKETLMAAIAPRIDLYKYVVFATHGFAGNSIPGIMEPVLALTMVPPGTDGLLTASEVAGLKMNAEVAALTACQTGLGLKLAGEGVMSMGRSFQLAGARSVVMSLWSVSETSSIKLMESFFNNLRQGKSKLEALTQARSELRSSGFEHPFFWSAFVLVGETK
ncbi:MAG: CHAT domain-containing protein [Desulfomonile tiedjei]|uniref:CHAT domain-containing protein n=1 Tax=Desulfomonile tiedjei TaxID=2358 RepID=A0A9D6V2Q0_9BACT|nr:CHAT domain-containing protein [Desulfomonile tiedjei]